MKRFTSFLKQLDKLADKYILVLIIALAGLVLRVPSFFEPIWYGDEAIYLTIGHSLNAGKVLYKDIVDHKTPLIYYLARVDSQLYFRLLTAIAMVGITIAFFALAKYILDNKKSDKPAYVATVIFMLLTTLPWLEGPMANGELWVMVFSIPALLLLTQVESVNTYFKSVHHFFGLKSRHDFGLIVGSGVLFGLALMTKVPALFDLAAGYFLLLLPHVIKITELLRQKKWSSIWVNLQPLLKQWLWLSVGIMIPFVMFLFIFTLKGGMADYLNYGLLYNFHYAGTWHPNFASPILALCFTLPGKAFILAVMLTLSLVLALKNHKTLAFVTGWSALTLFATLLSNRPYPHYLLQLVPSYVILLVLLYQQITRLLKTNQVSSKNSWPLLIGTTSCIWLVVSILAIKFYFYPTFPYFTRFWSRITKQTDYLNYAALYNPTVKDNILLTDFLKSQRVDRLYIWGSNPLLYAQGPFIPATQLITLFHIEDLNYQAQTLAQLVANPPPYIVVMKDNPINYTPFAAWLEANYIPNHQYSTATLWYKLNQPEVLGAFSLTTNQ